MTELPVINSQGLWKDAKIRARVLDDAELPKPKKKGLTKKQFEATLEKVFTRPVSGKSQESAPRAKRTSESRPSDGCSDTHTSQGSPEGKGD